MATWNFLQHYKASGPALGSIASCWTLLESLAITDNLIPTPPLIGLVLLWRKTGLYVNIWSGTLNQHNKHFSVLFLSGRVYGYVEHLYAAAPSSHFLPLPVTVVAQFTDSRTYWATIRRYLIWQVLPSVEQKLKPPH